MKKYDPNHYQGVDSEGNVRGVDVLTKKELQQNLCMAMDALERVENNISNALGLIEEWRSDDMEPEFEQ